MPDRLSPLDASFLYLEQSTTAMHVGSVMVFQPAGTPFSYERLVQHVAARIAYVPRYRQRVRAVPGRLANPVWVDDENFDITYHVRRSALPRPGTATQLQELVARLQARHLDRGRPLWELILVEGLADGRLAVLTKVHQALVDGVHAVDLGQVVLDADPDVHDPPAHTWHPVPEPTAVELLVGAVADSVRRPQAVLDTLRSGLGDVQATAGKVLEAFGGLALAARTATRPPPRSPLNPDIGQHRRFLMVSTDLEDYRRVRNHLLAGQRRRRRFPAAGGRRPGMRAGVSLNSSGGAALDTAFDVLAAGTAAPGAPGAPGPAGHPSPAGPAGAGQAVPARGSTTRPSVGASVVPDGGSTPLSGSGPGSATGTGTGSATGTGGAPGPDPGSGGAGRSGPEPGVAGPTTTINDVVLAVLAGGLRAWLLTRGEAVPPKSVVRALVPMSVRADDPGQAGAVGSRVASLLVDLPTGEPSPLMRLHQISYQTKAHREAGQAVDAPAIAGIAGFAPPTLHSLGARVASELSRRMFNTVITNVPGPQQPLYLLGARMVASYPVIPLARGQALSIGLTSYDGGVYYGLNGDRDTMPDLDVLGQCIVDALAEMVEAAR
jgi:diacylglycerol O-acyltransferase